MALEPGRSKDDVRAVAKTFLRLGLTAFGGPAGHIAVMEAELVRRRGWLTHERFLDLLGAANLLPGPSSTELAIFIGYEQAGVLGLLVAGTCFILPAAAMVLAIAWAYVRFGGLPQVIGALAGVKPVVIAIIVQAIVSLAPKAVRSPLLAGVGVAAAVALALHVHALVVLAGAGVLVMLVREPPRGMAALVPVPKIFLAFLKLGAVVFGSGYVLVGFLRDDLVTRLQWLEEPQLLDAIAVGQLTPGPVFTTATFIGYLLGRVPGAIAGTVAIFLPGFILVALARPLLPRVRASPHASAFLDGVNVASLALMAVATVELGRSVLIDVRSVVLAGVSVILLLRWKVNTTWLIAGSAAVGLILR